MRLLLVLPLLLLGGAKAPVPADPAAPASSPVPPSVIETAPVAAPVVDERKRPLRVAVYALESSGLDDARILRVTEASLLEEIRKLQRCSVISLDEVKALLEVEAQKQLSGCSESSCLAEIAEALGADALITGGVTQVDDTVTIALKRIDPAQAAVVQTFTRQLTAANGEELLAVVGPSVEALFPELPLRPGQSRGVAPEVALRLNPPPLSTPIFWSLAGVTGVSAMASVGAGTLLFVTNSTLQQTFANAKSTPATTQQVLDQQQQVVVSNVALWSFVGLTAAFGLATGFVAPFTDWQNLRGES